VRWPRATKAKVPWYSPGSGSVAARRSIAGASGVDIAVFRVVSAPKYAVTATSWPAGPRSVETTTRTVSTLSAGKTGIACRNAALPAFQS
jgi:hypothetical protein